MNIPENPKIVILQSFFSLIYFGIWDLDWKKQKYQEGLSKETDINRVRVAKKRTGYRSYFENTQQQEQKRKHTTINNN